MTSVGYKACAWWVGALLVGACGDDGANRLPDAPPGSDAPGGDAASACPGALDVALTFTDLETGVAQFECTVQELGMPDHHTLSDANGDAQICATSGASVDVIASCNNTGDHYARLPAAMLARLRAAGRSMPFRTITNSYKTTLAQMGIPSPAVNQLLVAVQVISLPTGDPLVGATVSTTATNSGLFARQANGTFTAGTTVAAGGVVLIANLAISPVPTVTVTPPGGFAGDCIGPASPATEMFGAAESVMTFVCQ